MNKPRYIPRSSEGRLHPSAAARRKVLYRCTECGWDLVRHEVVRVRERRMPLPGELMHKRRVFLERDASRWCGPVTFALNAAYRKQCG